MRDDENQQVEAERPPSRGSIVSVLALETGGCGACAQSVAALQSPRYRTQLAAQRITFVSSPRQANVVLLSGPMSKRSDQAIRRVLDLVPEPQALVAVGDCAINGCVFAGSPEISTSAAEALDVHIELPGCPPTPSSILDAVRRAAQLLEESEEDEDEPISNEVQEDLDQTGGDTEAPPEDSPAREMDEQALVDQGDTSDTAESATTKEAEGEE